MTLGEGFCPRYLHAVELVGRRWTGAIVRALLQGPARYNELVAAIPDLSDRMLSERLRELEAEGIVVRTVIPEVPVRVEYSLTDKGRALEQAIVAIARWAERWVNPPAEAAPAKSAAPARRTSQPPTRRRRTK
jgi:DNA-binding HxlR family transcriptional regulator